jgi:hypothetical protein
VRIKGRVVVFAPKALWPHNAQRTTTHIAIEEEKISQSLIVKVRCGVVAKTMSAMPPIADAGIVVTDQIFDDTAESTL